MPGGYVQYFWTFEFILLVRGYNVILSFSEEQCLRRYETPPSERTFWNLYIDCLSRCFRFSSSRSILDTCRMIA